MKKDLRQKIKRYYEKYYRNQLGLPDWKNSVKTRLDEEIAEREKIKNLEKILGSFNGKKILDVGCGTGGFLVEAQKKGGDTFGIDPELEAIKICALKGLKNVRVGEGEELPFPDNFFDIIYCYTVLEHVSDVKKTLQEMVRVLKPNGIAYIQTPNYLSCFEGHYKIFWLPLFPKSIASIYLNLRGRRSDFLKTINYLTPKKLKNYASELSVILKFLEHKDMRTQGIISWPLKIFYSLFNIDPQIELILKKTK